MFWKPKIQWTPKEIKGDVNIRKEDKVPELITTPTDTPLIRDNFPLEERQIMDDFLDELDKAEEDLNYIEQEVDKRINRIAIPYDPKEHPLVAAAHKCPNCFTKNNLVMTSNGFKYINEICLDDKILVKNGGFKDIYLLHKRPYQGNGIKIQLFNNSPEVICTDNHVFYTEGGLVSAKDLNINDYVLFGNPIDLSEDILDIDPYIVGLYIAEGSFKSGNWPREIQFSFHKNEIQYQNFVERYFTEKNIKTTKVFSKSSDSMQVIVYSADYAKLFSKLCGHLALNKKIPLIKSLYNERLLQGIIDGDGYLNKHGLINIKTISKNLALQIQMLAFYCGYKFISCGKYLSHTYKDGTFHNTAYEIRLRRERSKKDFIFGRYKIVNGKLYFKVKNIENIYLNEYVYNITINDENEHNYVVNGFVVKNCGDPQAPNIIRGKDILQKKKQQQDYNKKVASSIIPPDISSSPSSHQQKTTQDSINDMTTAVFNQILIWVLEFIYSIVSPLKNVPGADAIPKSIMNEIERLRGKKLTDAEKDARDKKWEDKGKYDEFIRESGGFNNIDSLSGLRQTCIQHIKDFNDHVPVIVDGHPDAPYIPMRDTNTAMKDDVDANKKLMSVSIPDGYERIKKPGLFFTNTLPEKYLQGRRDGKGVPASVLQGGLETIKDVNNQYIKEARKVLTNWWESPETLCCIIKNLAEIGNIQGISSQYQEGKKTLLTIRSILMLIRNLLVLNIRNEAADLVNLIINLVNGVITKIIQALAVLLKSQITDWLSKNVKLDYLMKSNVKCLPWNEMINLFGNYLKSLLEELLSYLTDFFVNVKLINGRAKKNIKNIGDVLKLDKWISLIDFILKFLLFMEYCLETGQEPEKIIRDNERKATMFPEEDINDTIQKLKNEPTILSGIGVEGLNLGKPGRPISEILKKEEPYKEKAFKPWKIDEPGMRILLTNFVGLNEEQSKVVLSDTGDCQCDNAISDEELIAIRNALLKDKLI